MQDGRASISLCMLFLIYLVYLRPNPNHENCHTVELTYSKVVVNRMQSPQSAVKDRGRECYSCHCQVDLKQNVMFPVRRSEAV